MKKPILYICGALLASGLMMSSCADNLDSDKYFNDRMELEDVFSEKNNTLRWLSHAYSFLSKQDNVEVGDFNATLFNFSDDIYFYKQNPDLYTQFKRGTYNENFRQQSWQDCYDGIWQATVFIHNVDKNDKLTPEERADYKAQARFVRAYYYWLLLKKYGPIVIAPDEGFDYTQTYDELSVPRSTYDECAEYIAEEMRIAAADLPLRRSPDELAMPTRGAALAVRAKVYLCAASPINNPLPEDKEKFTDFTNFDGKHLLAQEYDEKKWAKAAAAALDVIKLDRYKIHVEYAETNESNVSEGYPLTVTPWKDNDFSEQDWPNGYKNIDPYNSYRSLFNGDLKADANDELIFSRHQNMVSELRDFVSMCLPINSASGQNTIGMTQKMCDAYYMMDGKDCPGKERELNIDGRSDTRPRESGFVEPSDLDQPGYEHLVEGVSEQYAKREPRFYASVAFSGSVWFLLANLENPKYKDMTSVSVAYYRGEQGGYSANTPYLSTGIGFRKFVSPYDSRPNNQINPWILQKAEPAIRYADILLAYAEALNELTGTHDVQSWNGEETYSISRSVEEMKKGIRPVRCRAGIPDYEQNVYDSQVLLRAKLKRERQIEFVGESQRYFDLRRWKDVEFEESLDVYGCNILMDKNQKELFHTPTIAKDLTTVFTRKMYFWPISHTELKRNKNLVQNPGWMYND